MSVESILQQMAASAGNRIQRRADLWGGTIEGLSQIPGNLARDRERQQFIAEQRARQQGQDQRAANEDARRAQGDARDETARVAQEQYTKIVNTGLTAAMGDSGDPNQFDAKAAFAAVSQLGNPAAIRDVIKAHREMAQKITYGAAGTMGRDEAGLVIPGSQIPEKPPAPSPAGFAATATDPTKTPAERAAAKAALDAVQQTPGAAETARHNKELERIAALTAGRAEAAQKETARHNQATEGAANPFGVGGGPAGDELLAKMPADQRAQSQALVEGRRSLDARLASTPYGRTIIAGAYAIDPTFDQGNYNARNKARTDLTSPNGTGGKTIGALNTAIQHAGKLSDLIEKLDNYESPMANAVVNPLRTAVGKTEVTNYDTVAPQLAKEIERVWRGAGGTAGEIHDLIETIGHNKGKQQQREALQQFVDLAKGKLDSQEQQRDTVMGAAGKSIPILFESNKGIVDKIAQRAGVKPGGGTTPAAPAEGQTGWVNGVAAVWKTVNGKAGWYAQ